MSLALYWKCYRLHRQKNPDDFSGMPHKTKKHTYFKDTCAFLLTVFVIESKILGTGFRA